MDVILVLPGFLLKVCVSGTQSWLKFIRCQPPGKWERGKKWHDPNQRSWWHIPRHSAFLSTLVRSITSATRKPSKLWFWFIKQFGRVPFRSAGTRMGKESWHEAWEVNWIRRDWSFVSVFNGIFSSFLFCDAGKLLTVDCNGWWNVTTDFCWLFFIRWNQRNFSQKCVPCSQFRKTLGLTKGN